VNKEPLAFLIVGVLLGALPGFLIGQSMNTEEIENANTRDVEPIQATNPYPVPGTKAECYVAVGKATTQTGANLMIEYCLTQYSEF
jgi:hypothetical protein